MAIYLGTNNINDLGNINKVYIGNTKCFEKLPELKKGISRLVSVNSTITDKYRIVDTTQNIYIQITNNAQNNLLFGIIINTSDNNIIYSGNEDVSSSENFIQKLNIPTSSLNKTLLITILQNNMGLTYEII